MTSTFHNPVETYFGCSSFNQIDALTQNKSVVIVTFPQAHELGLIEKAQQLLGDRIIHIIDSVQPNPDVAELNEIYNKFWHEYAHCDVVVALGGGSTIDTAKALIVGTETKKFDQLLALLESDLELTLSASDDKTSQDMRELVTELAAMSPRITVKEATLARTPSFSINKAGAEASGVV